MLHAFESYCTRQGSASLLLQNLEKEKELLRIFLKVSQMENTVLRRMNLNSFLMVREKLSYDIFSNARLYIKNNSFLLGSRSKSNKISSPVGSITESYTFCTTRHTRSKRKSKTSSGYHRVTFGTYECCKYIINLYYKFRIKLISIF